MSLLILSFMSSLLYPQDVELYLACCGLIKTVCSWKEGGKKEERRKKGSQRILKS